MRTPATAALLAALALARPAPAQPDFRAELAVVQLNDVYRIDAVRNGTAGGLGRVVTLVEQTRARTRAPVMVLHAGDFIAPSLESTYFAGEQMIDALNFVHARAPLIAVPGNHEFDQDEPAMLAGAIRGSRFAWLAYNVRLNTGDAAVDRRLGRDTVVTTPGGMRVGIFTLTFLDEPRSYAAADTNFVALAEEQIRALESRGVDAIVGLTHLDLRIDRQIARLRASHPKFVWIAGGHEHYLIQEPLSDGAALITKGYSNARAVWRVLLGRRGGAPAVQADSVRLDPSIAPDPRYVTEVQEKWRARLREKVPFFDQPIGLSSVPLDAEEETVRGEVSNWGSWLAERARYAVKDVPADVGVLNGGAIRVDDVFQDTIRWEHLARTFGFPTRVGLAWVKGRDLRERLLENAVAANRGDGRFLQVSGVRFTYTRSAEPGRRVCSVEVQQGGQWAPLDERRVYVVAAPDYLFTGGDDNTFHNRSVLSVPPGADLKYLAFDELTLRYSRGQAIAPPQDDRIREVPQCPATP